MATLVSLESDLANVKDLVNFLIDRRVPFTKIGTGEPSPFDVANPWDVDIVPPTGDAVYGSEPIGHYVINVDNGKVWRKIATDSTLISSWSEFGSGISGGGGGIGEWQDSVLQFLYPVTTTTDIENITTAIDVNGDYNFRYVFIDTAADIDNSAGTAPNNIIFTAGEIYRLEGGATAPVLHSDALGDDGKRWIAANAFAQSVIELDDTTDSYVTPAAMSVAKDDILTFTYERDGGTGTEGFLKYDPTTGSFTSLDEAESSSGNDNAIYFYNGTDWSLYVAEETYKIEDVLTALDTVPDAYLSKPLLSLTQPSKLATPPTDSEISVNGIKVKDSSWEALEFDWSAATDITATASSVSSTQITTNGALTDNNKYFVGNVLEIVTSVDSYVVVVTDVDWTNDLITFDSGAATVSGTLTSVKTQGLESGAAVSATPNAGTSSFDEGAASSLATGDVILIWDGTDRHVRVVESVAGATVEYYGNEITGYTNYYPVSADYAATTVQGNVINTNYYISWKPKNAPDGYDSLSSAIITPTIFEQEYEIEIDDDVQLEYFSGDNS